MHTFQVITIIAWGVFWIYWFISALRYYSPVQRQESPILRLLYWILLILGLGILISDPLAFDPLLRRFLPDGVTVKLTGVIITFLGLGFAIWARLHLGQYWSARVTIKVEHKLIRTGPYRIVRNPIYTGMLFGVIGTAITAGEIRALLAIILVLAALLLKIRIEEKFLLEEFGSTYIQYRKEVKSLIPFLI
jgi:protein-S-isoprenylcysteine O-methyltransferase Ste14